MKIKAYYVIIPLLLLASITCSLPFQRLQPTSSPVAESPSDGAIGTVSREKSEVKHSTGNQAPVVVVSSDSLFTGDGVQIVNGGIGLLDFGDSLKLRLFNDSNLNVVSATQPGIPLVASLFLTIGGFTGELVQSGGKVVFQTPNQAEITVTGTEFFVGYDVEKQMATAGKWAGSMQVTSAGETISINDGYYVDIPAGQPPGPQIQNPLGFQVFEAMATELNDPLAAVDRIRPVETPTPYTQPSVQHLGPIERGQTVHGTIDSQGSDNEYSFESVTGENLIIRMLGDHSFNPAFQIMSADGVSLCEASGGIVQWICKIEAPGVYSLRVSGELSGPAGGYSIYFQSLTNPGSSVPLSYNQPYDDRVLDWGTMKTYEFGGSPGDLVLIRISHPEFKFYPDTWVYLNERLVDCKTSFQIISIVDYVCLLPEKGVYHLYTTDRGGWGTGSYQLYLTNLTGGRSAPVLDVKQRRVDKISAPSQMNIYTVFGKAGEKLDVRVLRDSGDLNLSARLFRLDGQIVCQGDTTEKELVVPCTLDGAQEYRLVIGSASSATTGSYVVWLAQP